MERTKLNIVEWAQENGLTEAAAIDLARRRNVEIAKLKGVRIIDKVKMDDALVVEINTQKIKQENRKKNRLKLTASQKEAFTLKRILETIGNTEFSKLISKLEVEKDMQDALTKYYDENKSKGITELRNEFNQTFDVDPVQPIVNKMLETTQTDSFILRDRYELLKKASQDLKNKNENKP